MTPPELTPEREAELARRIANPGVVITADEWVNQLRSQEEKLSQPSHQPKTTCLGCKTTYFRGEADRAPKCPKCGVVAMPPLEDMNNTLALRIIGLIDAHVDNFIDEEEGPKASQALADGVGELSPHMLKRLLLRWLGGATLETPKAAGLYKCKAVGHPPTVVHVHPDKHHPEKLVVKSLQTQYEFAVDSVFYKDAMWEPVEFPEEMR